MILEQFISYFNYSLLTILMILIIVAFIIQRNRRGAADYQEEKNLRGLLPKQLKVNKWENLTGYLYPYYYRSPVVRILLNRIRMRLTMLHAGDELLIRKRSASYTSIILLVMVVLISLSFVTTDSWAMRLGIMITSFYVGGFLIDILIHRTKLEILKQESELILDLRHNYNHTFMVKESLEQAADKTSAMVGVHARKIAEIFEAENPENELLEYYESAPNRYMKQVAGLSYKIGEHGDSNVRAGEESIYLNSLSHIREEIHMELGYREQLNRKLGGLMFISVSPIFFLQPIKWWAISMFPSIEGYYNSAWGWYSLVLLFVSFIISFFVLRFAKNVEGDTQGVIEEGKWLNQFLNFPILRKLVNRVAPDEHEPEYFKTMEKIKEANSKLSIQSFYLQKLLFTLIVFLIMVIIQFSIHGSMRSALLNPSGISNANVSQTSGQQKLTQERLAFEKLAMSEIIHNKLTPDQIPAYLMKKLEDKRFFTQDITKEIFVAEIVERLAKYDNEFYRWYEILIAFALAVISYFVPDYLLMIRKNSRKWEKQNEVDSFNSSVMMLSRIPAISVYEIVEWLERDSYVFKDELTQCLLDYSKGAYEALEELKKNVRFVPMERIADRLQNAAENIPIKNAFDDMVSERTFQLDQRREHYEQMITFKTEIGVESGFFPFRATFFVYLVFPFTYYMYQFMDELTVITSNL